jgi:hypothetical protein
MACYRDTFTYTFYIILYVFSHLSLGLPTFLHKLQSHQRRLVFCIHRKSLLRIIVLIFFGDDSVYIKIDY